MILSVIWMHWFADFFCQTDKMAINKSTSIAWLGLHAAVYTAWMCVFGWQFGIVNGLSHFIIDAISSRVTSHLYKKGDRHNFFVVIGIDQAVHMTSLILTFQMINPIWR